MPNETVDATAAANREFSGLFEQGFRAMGESLKAAIKAQEESVKFWSDLLGKTNPLQAWAGDWIPVAQKNTDEYVRLMESSYRRSTDLMNKAVHSQNGDGIGLEKRTREWVDASLELARDNAQEVAGANLRVAQSWTEVFKKGAPQKAAVGK